MTSATAGRSRRIVQIITVVLVAVIAALLAFMIISGFLTGTLTLGKVLLPVLSLLTIVLVTGVVGLVVAGHQPRNPIGWLPVGEAVFILLSVAGRAHADLVYRLGYHDLAFAAAGTRARPAVQLPAAAGPAPGGPPVQPGPLRRRPDGRRVRGAVKDTVDMESVRDDLASVVHQALNRPHVSVRIGEVGNH